ncbi:tyrosine-type recombinase/integrase [Pleurocapsa sp. PCC 7319]|uniref:tyrosine-type recombinase/integrase n=1 Tax=Pleurocapsa sp. PCC 7319 TaxID=118161 RepID=UPI000A034C5C|nr:tyrosine-type recombinase/integrase [Pleurocapsa sp. PCC 7319]
MRKAQLKTTKAELSLSVPLHILRHACGFYLVSRGCDTRAIQAYLCHHHIQHTVRYTELPSKRFQDFGWIDWGRDSPWKICRDFYLPRFFPLS